MAPIFSEIELINFRILEVISYGGFCMIVSFDSIKGSVISYEIENNETKNTFNDAVPFNQRKDNKFST